MSEMRFNLTAKFMIGIGLLLMLAVGLISFMFYWYMRDLYIEETHQKTDLVLGHINATMEYVRDELRPQMFHILPKEEFIREAMSTSFVNKGIMDRFGKIFPNYIYRRVSINPMNPTNKADSFEEDFIRKFFKNVSGEMQWKGLVEKGGNRYFINVKAIKMEEQCVTCHGDPALAPKSLLSHYGRDRGHNLKVGDVIGLESIAIPVDETFYKIRRITFSIFMTGLVGMAILFIMLNYIYYKVAVGPIHRVSAFFKSVASGEKGLGEKLDIKGRDEITELVESFNTMAEHLVRSQDEKQKVEEKLRQSDKLASIGQLAAGVAHEINNPLGVVIGYSKLLMKNRTGDNKAMEDLGVIHKNAQICKKIVGDLLNFSRQRITKPERGDLNGAVRASVTEQEAEFEKKNIVVSAEYDFSIPLIYLDADKMKQVFANILINACHATELGGAIKVATHYEREENVAVVTFSDTGHGIPEDIMGKIFDPFFTTKGPGEGTGLGLSVSYGIVRDHNGHIGVESRVNEGATFWIKLPVGDTKL